MLVAHDELNLEGLRFLIEEKGTLADREVDVGKPQKYSKIHL